MTVHSLKKINQLSQTALNPQHILATACSSKTLQEIKHITIRLYHFNFDIDMLLWEKECGLQDFFFNYII